METLPEFAELRADGLVEHIGVSNFEPHHLDAARDVLGDLPFANQVEMHPLLRQEELRAYAADYDLELVAYSPLARGKVFDVPEVKEVAEKHGASEAQVSLAWLREKGVAAIPKATSEAHIHRCDGGEFAPLRERDNWESLGLDLDEEDVATIDAIDRTDRRIHPDFAPDEW